MTNRTTQRETVVGVFNDRDTAQAAIEQLKSAGFRPDDIGILMQNKEGAQDLATETGTKAGEGAGKGAVTGGILGGLGGLLVGIGALAIPGIGPVVAAGPLAAGLGAVLGSTATGAVIGAGVGAIAGALIGMGVPEDEARVYEERFNQGRILVTVKAGANRYSEAERILRNASAEQIDFRNAGAGSYTQSQTGYAQNQGSYTQGQTGYAQDQSNYGQGNYTQGQTADRMRVPVVEETLNVEKGQREAGQVEIRKNVREEQVNVPVELRHEEVTVTRHATDRPVQPGEQVLEDDQVIRVPVREETAEVQKQARVREEIEINKQQVTEQRNVSDTVRREEIDVNTQGSVQAREGKGGLRQSDRSADTPYTDETDTTYNQNQ
jgi:uncharacterized protein (TIGR02271 family)